MKQFPPGTRPEDTRKIEVEVEVDASVEEVWPYLSTSEGLSSWYVGAEFEEEKEGAKCTLTFGPGMEVPAFVQAYEANDHVRLGPPPGVDSPRVEEYSVRPKEGGGCLVRVVNWGFGEGADWDAEYDAVKKGWGIFLGGLKVIVERFRRLGYPATLQLVGMSADAASAWEKMSAALGASALGEAKLGQEVTLRAGSPGQITGTVYALGEREIGLFHATADGGVHLFAAVESPDGVSGMNSASLRLFGARKREASSLQSDWSSWFQEAFPPA